MAATTTNPTSSMADSAPRYDPLNPTPYKPDQGSIAPPPITAPPPQVSPEDSQQPKTPGPMGKGKGAAVGKAAFLADSILRGVMRGRQQHAEREAAKTDKLAKGLQFAYQNAANHYVDLVKGGADPNSKEVQEAGMAADAAWQSMMKMYGNYIMGDQDKKGKSKSKSGGKGGKAGDQPENPAELLMSQDPHDKIKGWFMISQKAGAPYKYQAQQYLTPEYKQDRANYAATQQTERDILAKRNEMHALQNMDPAKLDEHQKSRLEQLRTDPELFPEMAKKPTKIGEYVDDKGFKHIKFRNNDGSTFEEMGDEKSRSLASENGKRAWTKDDKGKITSILVDPKTNQKIPGSENSEIMPPASQMDTIRTSEFSFTDDQGILHRIPTTSTTTHVPHGGEGGGHPTTAAGAGGGHPSSPSTAPSAGGPGGRVIGDTGKSQGAKNVRKAAESTRVMADLLSTQSDYMKSIEKNPSAATPRQDLALIIASVRAMNPGSVRLPQKELELEIAAGSWGDRAKRQWDIATTGKLPDDQRKQLFTIVKDEVTTRGKHVVEDWKTVLKNEPIPAHLKQFDTEGSTGGDANANQALHPELKSRFDSAFGTEKP